MQSLEKKILEDGIIIGNDILKVDSFINHQIDCNLLWNISRHIANKFQNDDKIVTIETSGIAFAVGIAIWTLYSTDWSDNEEVWKDFINKNKALYKALFWILVAFTFISLIVMVIAYIWIVWNSVAFIFAKNSFLTKVWSIITLACGLLILTLWVLNITGQFINMKSIKGIMPQKSWDIIGWVAAFSTYGLILTTGICKHCVRTANIKNNN